MASYRIYLLDDNGRIAYGRDADCDSDAEACSAACEMLKAGAKAEVWQSTRRVGRVSMPLVPPLHIH